MTLVNGFHPATGDSFPILTFGSTSGDFAVVNGRALGQALYLAERFNPLPNPTALNLDVNRAILDYQIQPVDTLAGAALPVVVRLTDNLGSTLTFDSIDQVALTLNQNTFGDGTTTAVLPVANGVASFLLTIDQAATGYQLTAGGSGFADVPSNLFTIQQSALLISGGSTTFLVGTFGSFSVSASGVPAPALSEVGALPGGVSFTDNGDGTATLSGTPDAGSAGNYSFAITANNGVGAAVTQNFVLTVAQAPAITSLAAATFTTGSVGTFAVVSTGLPTALLSESGALPGGVSFTDNGNGTATLSGTPDAGSGGSYAFTITANNGTGTAASQNFTLTVNQSPALYEQHFRDVHRRRRGCLHGDLDRLPGGARERTGRSAGRRELHIQRQWYGDTGWNSRCRDRRQLPHHTLCG